ncbi:outer membrane beta-barrel protein [Longibacter salinarum]|nr:outer membrane beta-barrel protein [Longibacter salinarum]
MKRLLVALVTTLIFVTSPAIAQDRFGAEFRAGAHFATEDVGEADLNTGFGTEFIVSYRFLPQFGLYAGFGYHRFTSDDTFGGDDVVLEETGYTFGVQFENLLPDRSFGYFLRAGGLLNHMEFDTESSDFSTDHSLGWQVEVGPLFTFGNQWSIKPGIRYHSLSQDVDVAGTEFEVDLTYISVGASVGWRF